MLSYFCVRNRKGIYIYTYLRNIQEAYGTRLQMRTPNKHKEYVFRIIKGDRNNICSRVYKYCWLFFFFSV